MEVIDTFSQQDTQCHTLSSFPSQTHYLLLRRNVVYGGCHIFRNVLVRDTAQHVGRTDDGIVDSGAIEDHDHDTERGSLGVIPELEMTFDEPDLVCLQNVPVEPSGGCAYGEKTDNGLSFEVFEVCLATPGFDFLVGGLTQKHIHSFIHAFNW